MKKTAAALVLGLAGSAMLAIGAFASEPTVDEILANSSAASQEAKEFNATADLNADIQISVPDLPEDQGTFKINAAMSADMAIKMDPILIGADYSMNYEAMGEGDSMNYNMYIAGKDDNSIGTYIGMDNGTGEIAWEYEEVPAETGKALLEAISNQTLDYSAFPIDFVLNEDNSDVDGKECYNLTASLGWGDLKEVINTALDAASSSAEGMEDQLAQVEGYLAAADAFLGGLNVNIEMDVDTETYLPVHVCIDTEGSDWTVLGAMFASMTGLTNDDGALMNVDLNVNDLSITYFYDYDSPVEITIPDEAIASEANGNVLDADALSDAMSELG